MDADVLVIHVKVQWSLTYVYVLHGMGIWEPHTNRNKSELFLGIVSWSILEKDNMLTYYIKFMKLVQVQNKGSETHLTPCSIKVYK